MTEAAHDLLEHRVPIVGLVHDDHLALRLGVEVENGDHAREHEGRLGIWPEEGTGHPAVHVGALAEERDATLDAGQVLEVGGQAEED